MDAYILYTELDLLCQVGVILSIYSYHSCQNHAVRERILKVLEQLSLHNSYITYIKVFNLYDAQHHDSGYSGCEMNDHGGIIIYLLGVIIETKSLVIMYLS